MAETAHDLAARISADEIRSLEARGREGWPALEVAALEGWQLGASGRYTRRANSVAPEVDGESSLERRIDRVEAWYAERALDPVFKMTAASRPAELDAALAARGYTLHSETIVMELHLKSFLAGSTGEGDPVEPAVGGGRRTVEAVANRVDPAWWRASCAGSSVAPSREADYRALLDHAIDRADAAIFGSAAVGGAIVAVALGNVRDGTVHLVQVATLPESRGRRHADAVLRAILFAAREHGPRRALLSVEVDNPAARRLYARLGFEERYRYGYRERVRARGRPRG